ncbi:flagellin [Hydrogenimonas sp. SS33]|uniref:flagellin N-terminal helical domain-containing protein n=1 Tax=Hydrogenimonas leucolamina TaxID=2954236 RepID=UPI00336BE704
MGFRINTNIGAMNAHRNALMTNKRLNTNLERLSSGLRINKAADDASGMAIADSLRAQSQGLGQAIRNANDGIGVVQTADGALDEYINIIDTVRTKAIQAASDGQNDDSRMAIQRDINRLLEEANNIAKTTSFNGLKLLDGSYTDKKFQIGAYANETVNISISDTRTTTVGQFAYGHGTATTAALAAGDLVVNGADVGATADAQASTIATAINNLDVGVTATAKTTVKGANAVAGGSIAAGDFKINGIDIGAVTFSASDSTGKLVTAINNKSDETGVKASLENGALLLTNEDGGDITIAIANGADAKIFGGTAGGNNVYVDGSATAEAAAGTKHGFITLESDSQINLTGNDETKAGFTDNETISLANAISTADVRTYDAAQLTIKKADHALAQLDRTRSDIGSVQNQLESTIRNISVTQVNVTAAESQIRDVDFAQESADFAKNNILAQSGSYALSQANAVQQNVLRLLQ